MGNLQKITSRQFIMLWLVMTLAVIVESGLTRTAKLAGPDSWLSALLGILIGAWSLLFIAGTAAKYPGKTAGQFCQSIFGKFTGTLIVIAYIISFLSYCALLMDEYGHAMTSIFVPENPEYVYHVLVMLPAVYAAWLGIAVAARLSEILFLPGFIVVVLVLIFNYSNIDITNFLPFLERGPGPVLKGSMAMGGRLTPCVVLLALYPLIMDKDNFGRYKIAGILWLAVTVQAVILLVAVFGPEYMSTMHFPFVEVLRSIPLSDTLARLDAIIMTTWIIGVFIFVSCFVYGASVLTRDLLGIKSHRAVALVYSLLVTFLASLGNNIILFRDIVGPPLSYSIMSTNVILPFIMFIIASIKNPPKSCDTG